jgi:hypothetical protein
MGWQILVNFIPCLSKHILAARIHFLNKQLYFIFSVVGTFFSFDQPGIQSPKRYSVHVPERFHCKNINLDNKQHTLAETHATRLDMLERISLFVKQTTMLVCAFI